MRPSCRLVAFAFTVAALGAPVPGHALQASSSEQSATNAYFDCLVHAAQLADDRQTDASAVALRIEPSCVGPEAEEKARFRATLDPSSASKFDQLWPDVRQSTATKAVLVARGAPTVGSRP